MRSKYKRQFIIILIALLLLFMTKAYYDTNSVEIRHYQIENSSLGIVLNGLKVAHLSDLHIKDIGARENEILEILNDEKPDLIFITGDFIHFEGPYEPFMSFVHQLKPSLGVYSVLGNTEYSNENGSCLLCHKEKSRNLKENQKAVFLRNSLVPLEINGKVLNIVGVDDPVNKKSDLKKALKDVNSEYPIILLAHSPEIFKETLGLEIDFLLAGHTHGGQIFLTRLLRKVIPLEKALEYLDGFFQKGKTLMYVSRGIGTSFLPFRLGVKPEITFFNFSSNITNSSNSINMIDPTPPINTLSISNVPPTTIFTSFNFSTLIETFNMLNIFDSLGITPFPQHRSTAALQHSSTSSTLFDFESDSDLERLNWECGKWFERSQEHVTSGKYSLRVVFPPSQYPGINFEEIRKNWSGPENLRMDVYNPSTENMTFHIRIDDAESGWEYADRFDINFILKSGMNNLMIPTDSVRTNLYHKPLNLGKIERFMVFVPNNNKRQELYLDNIRLE
jgi:uncharacterized protein